MNAELIQNDFFLHKAHDVGLCSIVETKNPLPSIDTVSLLDDETSACPLATHCMIKTIAIPTFDCISLLKITKKFWSLDAVIETINGNTSIIFHQNLFLRMYLLSLYRSHRRKAFHVMRCIIYVQRNRNQVYKFSIENIKSLKINVNLIKNSELDWPQGLQLSQLIFQGCWIRLKTIISTI